MKQLINTKLQQLQKLITECAFIAWSIDCQDWRIKPAKPPFVATRCLFVYASERSASILSRKDRYTVARDPDGSARDPGEAGHSRYYRITGWNRTCGEYFLASLAVFTAWRHCTLRCGMPRQFCFVRPSICLSHCVQTARHVSKLYSAIVRAPVFYSLRSNIWKNTYSVFMGIKYK